MRKIADICIILLFASLLIAALAQGTGGIVNPYLWNGTSFRPVSIDSATRAQNIIEYEHHEVHGGSMYHVTRVVQIDDAASTELLIDTPDTTKWGHMTIQVQGSFDTEWWLFEATTKTGGTAMTEHNHERNSANVATIVVTHTPGGAGDGNEIHHERFGNDSGPAGQGGGSGQSRGTLEWVLKQNEEYLLRVTSHTDTNNISIIIDWYEHTNKTP